MGRERFPEVELSVKRMKATAVSAFQMGSGRRGRSRLDQRGSYRGGVVGSASRKRNEQNPSASAHGRVYKRGRARSRLRSSISPRVQSNRPPLVKNELRGGDNRFPSEWRFSHLYCRTKLIKDLQACIETQPCPSGRQLKGEPIPDQSHALSI